MLDGGEKIIKPGASGMGFSILGVLWGVKSALSVHKRRRCGPLQALDRPPRWLRRGAGKRRQGLL